MSVISDSRRPARAGQALGQVVVRLSALRFANCAPVACYGCADQALFQCLFGKIVIHAQDLRILKSLGFEDPQILKMYLGINGLFPD